MLDGVRPGALLIAAAMADVDRCQREPRLSFAANVRLPEIVSRECARRGIFVVHLSTDYVFDGRGGPYAEDDATGPVNVYGRHKLEGERMVLESGAAAAVLRTCVVYGGDRPGAAETVAAALREGRTVRLSETHVNTPTHVADLAWAVHAVLRQGVTGLFHTGGPEPMSRLEFGRAVAHALGRDPDSVEPAAPATGGDRAPRPAACGLRVDKAAAAFGYRPRPVGEGLAALFGADAAARPGS